MKAIKIVAVVILVFVSLVFVVRGFMNVLPQCLEEKPTYYWIGWAAGEHMAGHDLKEALQIANGRPLTLKDECVKWNK